MSSLATELQKIVVTLSETDIALEPGSVAQLIVTMTNRQDSPDRLALEIEGVDVEWYSIPVAAVNVAPGAQASERIIFKVTRNSENRTDSYPFLVRVQAMETGEVGVAQATLTVKPYHNIQVDLDPKRGLATFFRPLNEFDVAVFNHGNDEETLDLYASDPEDGCAYEFDTDRVTLKPGQTINVPLIMRPKVASVLGGACLYGFTVSARAVDDAYVSANAHGQLEKRALISPLLGIFFLLLGIGTGGWFLLRPRPPVPIAINDFTATPTRVEFGKEIALSWDLSGDFNQIIIKRRTGKGGVDVADPGEQKTAVGKVVTKPDYPSTTYTLIVRGNHQPEQTKQITVNVGNPPRENAPSIRAFRADPPAIHQGETFTLSWEVADAETVILDPGNLQFSRFVQSTQPMTLDEERTFTLRALGKSDKMPPASKTLTVRVVSKDVCLAEIKGFRVVTNPVYMGDKIRLKWKTAFARTVRIDTDKGPGIGEVANPGDGTIDIPTAITETTTFTLTATDSANKTVTQTVTVTPKERPLPPPDPTPVPPGNAEEKGTPPGTTGTNPG